MKKISILLVIMLLPTLNMFAQNDIISTLFSQYAEDENFTKVTVSSKMFQLFTNIEPGDKDEEEILDAISKLKGLKVLASDSVANPRQLFDNVVKKITSEKYEELMEVKDADEDMKFMIKETKGVISELIMVIGGNRRFVLISLYGEIDLKNISKLSKSLNIKGMEYLQHVNDSTANHS